MHALLEMIFVQASRHPVLAQAMDQTYSARPGYAFWSWWWFWLLVAALVAVLIFAFGSFGQGPRRRGPPTAPPPA